MRIRSDFKALEKPLTQLIDQASYFEHNQKERWSSLKSNTAFKQLQESSADAYKVLNNIFTNGNKLATFLASELPMFNYPDVHRTIKRFVDSFHTTLLYQHHLLQEESEIAKAIYASLPNGPEVIETMITLYDEQITALLATQDIMFELKESNLYKWECSSEKCQIF
jgi:hypothetical protein